MSGRATLYCGDALAILQTLPAESVQMVCTSPPYWGLRDYGMPGQLGLEPTPVEYTTRLVALFQEVRRTLRDDGVVWLNLGDCYARAWACGRRNVVGQGAPAVEERQRRILQTVRGKRMERGTGRWGGGDNPVPGLKEKDLVGLPWRVALALQADGWWLRSDNIWAKPNSMPESVQDRPSRSHEYVFLLTKSARYFYDADAARTPMEPSSETRLAQDVGSQVGSERGNGGGKTNGTMKAVRRTDKQRGHSRRHDGFNDRWDQMERSEQQANGANLRSVWWIAPAQYRDAHFAVMPEKLATICIAAGSRPGDTVVDPFGGSGTVASVATGMGRDSIYIDLNPAYLELAKQRIGPLLCDMAVV